MNADGSGMTQINKIFCEYISGESQLFGSPDGTKIAFLFGASPKQQIYTINADGSNLKNLTNNPQNEVYNVKLFWSPDNSRIAYYYNKPGDLAGEQQDIYLLDINRGQPRTSPKNPETTANFRGRRMANLLPSWSVSSTIKKYTQSMLTVTSSIN